MTDRDQHTGLPVRGYQPQSAEAIAAVNELKAAEERVLRLLDGLPAKGADPRWAAVARTQIEQGFMAANRSIFQPGRIALPEDEGGAA